MPRIYLYPLSLAQGTLDPRWVNPTYSHFRNRWKVLTTFTSDFCFSPHPYASWRAIFSGAIYIALRAELAERKNYTFSVVQPCFSRFCWKLFCSKAYTIFFSSFSHFKIGLQGQVIAPDMIKHDQKSSFFGTGAETGHPKFEIFSKIT